MSVVTARMTIAEYEKLAPPADGWWELRHGELIKVTFPRKIHFRLQMRLFALLAKQLHAFGFVGTEFAFRPAPEHELWAADIAVATWARWNAVNDNDWLIGSPEIVIEVLSPSNTPSEMLDRERTCMRGGTKEFWIVDPERKLIGVSRVEAGSSTYAEGDAIPLGPFGGSEIPVAAIFADASDE